MPVKNTQSNLVNHPAIDFDAFVNQFFSGASE